MTDDFTGGDTEAEGPGSSSQGGTKRAGRPYLLLLHRGATRVVHLPADAEYVVGRDPGVDVPIEDRSISRRHVVLSVKGRDVVLSDLGSLNGSRVNGQRIAEQGHALHSGDVISIGAVQLIFQRSGGAPAPSHLPLPGAAFGQRLQAEVERSMRYQHPMALLVLETAGPIGEGCQLLEVLFERLRTMDVVGTLDERCLAVLLPEVSSEYGPLVANRILEAMLPFDPQVRAGMASWPDDSVEPDALLDAARAAARGSKPGAFGTASQTTTEVQVGSQAACFADAGTIRLLSLVERIAPTDLAVLIHGETGVGKEIFAALLHARSARASERMVAVNCATISLSLAESELFGHQRGAFTGAHADRVGLIESAHLGTLFLDEIGELPLTIQVKLLRVLQEGELTRVGENQVRKVDVRLLAASNRDLRAEAEQGRFRQDLFFRISAVMLTVPPLRDRPREIALLAQRFAAEAGARTGRAAPQLAPDTVRLLTRHPWPGNVRELRNVVERAVALTHGAMIEPWALPPEMSLSRPDPGRHRTLPPLAASEPIAPEKMEFVALQTELRDLEQQRMKEALAATDDHQAEAAALLQMPLRTFENKLKSYGIKPGKRGRRRT